MMRRRKECRFCVEHGEEITPFAGYLSGFLTEKGKIVSRRTTGICARHQRKLTSAIKQARNLGILPYIER
ncbi:30S ribosomal protein S18 [bacterium]|nr:30S ribosomal protein S18 [bacterium]